ncbi:alpha/beta hydrolase [Halioglobus maricola]|uniref:Alpha/beta hydrolase n=2 Tax=Halioglobus maricola TaxID=2601894 RepID=A0A5P9NPV9_9GAMM|nr:alpha/beta hydrolase [Halioglobus maricola]
MLHPSPLSSAFLEPLIRFLADDFDVIALDTPGYGDSDPLPAAADNLEPYVAVIGEVLAQLGDNRFLLYGNATGAQLAVESAKLFPQVVAGVVLENAAAFSDIEREEIMDGYFPDLTPQEDGSHIELAWKIARQTFQYFPWYDTSDAARIADAEPPRALVEATVNAYLKAGPDYARAYRLAFANERPEQLAAVTVPTRVMMWQDALLLAYGERLRHAGLPKNIEFVDAAEGIEARYIALREAFLSFER